MYKSLHVREHQIAKPLLFKQQWYLNQQLINNYDNFSQTTQLSITYVFSFQQTKTIAIVDKQNQQEQSQLVAIINGLIELNLPQNQTYFIIMFANQLAHINGFHLLIPQLRHKLQWINYFLTKFVNSVFQLNLRIFYCLEIQFLEGKHEVLDILLFESNINAKDEDIKLEKYLSLGRQFVKIDNYSAGIIMFDQVLKLNPQNCDALLEKGCALQKLKSYQEALDQLNECLILDPLRAEAYYQKGCIRYYSFLGIVLQCMNKDSDALPLFESALLLDPLNKYYLETKADYLGKINKHSEAIILYDLLIKQDPLNLKYYQKKGIKFIVNQSKMRSNVAFHINTQKLISRLSNQILQTMKFIMIQVHIIINLGLAYNRQKQLFEAIMMIDKAIELNENILTYHLNKGKILYENDEFIKARDAFQIAIYKDPQSAEAYYYKGQILYKIQGLSHYFLEDYEDAVEMYDRAIDIDPENADYWCEKGVTLSELGDYQSAKYAYNQAIRIDPYDADIYNSKGLMFQQMDNHKAAIQMFDKAISLNDEEPAYYYNKGKSYVSMESFNQAQKSFNQAIYYDPTNYSFYKNKDHYSNQKNISIQKGCQKKYQNQTLRWKAMLRNGQVCLRIYLGICDDYI
ncbi:hypothetical protein pb186bvf_002149 [Paramecium bursaria]